MNFKKISCLTKIFLITIVIFMFCKDSLFFFGESNNDNLEKKLETQYILKNQKEIYDNDIFTPVGNFNGSLTGYGADCPKCSGFLGCNMVNVFKNGIYYNDATYGKVRIVATSKNYPCGSILRFDVNKISSEPLIAIVLDRGVTGNTVDLLSESEDFARKYVGRVNNLGFDILRKGW